MSHLRSLFYLLLIHLVLYNVKTPKFIYFKANRISLEERIGKNILSRINE